MTNTKSLTIKPTYHNQGNQLIRIIKILITIMSILSIGTFIILALLRMSYPYELSWYEGDAMNQVNHILNDKHIYVPPSIEYIPMVYAPLYFYVSALLAKILGPHLYTLRIVSFSASLGTLYMIYLFIKKEAKNTIFSIIGAGLFATTYPATGAFWDIARVDSLFIFLLFVSLYYSRFGKHKKDHILAAFIFVLACVTKQLTLIMLPFTCVYYLFTERRHLLSYLITIIVFFIATNSLLDIIHNGWYSYYVYALLKKHLFNIKYLFVFLGLDIMNIIIAMFVSAIYLRFLFINKHKYAIFYTAVIGGTIVLSCLSRLNIGGSNNTITPMYAAAAIGFGLALNHLYQRSYKKNILETPHITFIFLLTLVQYIILIYNPISLIPTRQTRKSTEQLISFIKDQPNDVFIPSNIYLLNLANKPMHADMHMANELLGGFGDTRPTQEGTAIISQVIQKIRTESFDTIILDKYDYHQYYYMVLKDMIEAHYKKSNISFSVWRGTQAAPVYVYIRRK